MSSNIANEGSNWVSGATRPVSHSSEMKRSRKALKNQKARQRKQARKRECTSSSAADAAVALVAASHGEHTAPTVQELHQQHRPELEDVAELSDPGVAAHPETTATQQGTYAPAEDFDVVENDHHATVKGEAGLQPSHPSSETSVRDSLPQPEPSSEGPLSPSTPQPPQPRQSHFVEEGTAEFEEWSKTRARLTAWAREAEADMKRALGQEPGYRQRRYAPPSERYSLPILSRTAAFAVQCGFSPGIAPLLLYHVVRTIFGEAFASNVVALSVEEVDYMFAVFWEQQVAPLTEAERLFGLVTSSGSDTAMTKDNLRPIITGAIQNHPEFLELTDHNQIQYLENVVSTTFCRLGRYGVISLDDLSRSDFAASLNAVGRHEIGLEESIYFSRFISLSMVPNLGYQQLSPSPYGRVGAEWSTGLSSGLSPYSSGNSNMFWASSP